MAELTHSFHVVRVLRLMLQSKVLYYLGEGTEKKCLNLKKDADLERMKGLSSFQLC